MKCYIKTENELFNHSVKRTLNVFFFFFNFFYLFFLGKKKKTIIHISETFTSEKHLHQRTKLLRQEEKDFPSKLHH